MSPPLYHILPQNGSSLSTLRSPTQTATACTHHFMPSDSPENVSTAACDAAIEHVYDPPPAATMPRMLNAVDTRRMPASRPNDDMRVDLSSILLRRASCSRQRAPSNARLQVEFSLAVAPVGGAGETWLRESEKAFVPVC